MSKIASSDQEFMKNYSMTAKDQARDDANKKRVLALMTKQRIKVAYRTMKNAMRVYSIIDNSPSFNINNQEKKITSAKTGKDVKLPRDSCFGPDAYEIFFNVVQYASDKGFMYAKKSKSFWNKKAGQTKDTKEGQVMKTVTEQMFFDLFGKITPDRYTGEGETGVNGVQTSIPYPGNLIPTERGKVVTTFDLHDNNPPYKKLVNWHGTTLRAWHDGKTVKERAAVIAAINQKKYKGAGAGSANAKALSDRLKKLDKTLAPVSFDVMQSDYLVSESRRLTKEGKKVVEELEERASLMVNAFSPESAEKAFAKIQDRYVSLRKGSKDQHLLSIYATEILNHRESDKSRGVKGRIFSLSKGLDTSRLTNILNFKMQDVKETGYDGFLINPIVTLNNAQLSSLTPVVEFFLKTRGPSPKYTSIPLQNRGLSTGGGIGPAAINKFQSILGLQDVTVRLAGDTPETAKRDIDATVTFYGTNLSVFSNERGRKYYVPLIQPEGLGGAVFGPKDLMMKIGWATPSVSAQKALNFTDAQISAIQRQTKTLVMSYYKHSFNFNEDGSFILQADYVSRVSESLQDADVMSDNDSEVSRFYKDLISKFRSKTMRGNLSDDSKKLVFEYINSVHPTVSEKTKKTIESFFRRVKKQSEIPEFIRRHTHFFQDKKSDKIKACLNRLTDKNQMYRVKIQGSTYKERFFTFAFDRVIAPYYPTVIKNSLKNADKMPPSISKAETVGVFKKKCRFRLLVSQSLEVNPPAPVPVAVSKVTVTRDTSGEGLPSLSDGSPEPEEKTNKSKGKVNQSKTKKKKKKKTKTAAETVESNDPKTTTGKKKDAEEQKKKREAAEKAAEERIKAGKADDNKDEVEQGKADKEDAKVVETAAAEERDSEHVIYYFRLGDIITAFMEISESDKYFTRERINIMLGNIKIDGKYQNLYSMPIAMQVYQKVMSDFENSTARRFSLQRLVSAFLKEVQRYFNQGDYVLDSGRYNSAYSIKCGQFKTTSVKLSFLKNAKSAAALYNQGYGSEPPDTDCHSVYYYTMGQASTKLQLIDAKKLSKWEVGGDRSVIKKISFKQVESGVMKAKQDENIKKAFNSEQGLLMIPQLYNVDITSYGLVDFYPGLSFFIKPTLIGVSDINNSPIFKEVGITGLYNVINVEHKISMNGFDTTFKCYNEATIDWSEAVARVKPGFKRQKVAMVAVPREEPKKTRSKKDGDIASILRADNEGKKITKEEYTQLVRANFKDNSTMKEEEYRKKWQKFNDKRRSVTPEMLEGLD